MKFRLLVVCLAAVCCGCEADRFPIAPASGTVTFNGKPLAGAHVLFQPVRTDGAIEAGPESVGRTDETGRYSLSTISPERTGAMIGQHRVSVTIPEEEQRFGGGAETGDGGTRGPARYTLPERYRLGTDLVVEVPREGSDKLDLVLTSP